MLFIVFWGFVSTCKLSWILNSSSFLQYWLEFSKFTFPISSHPFDLESLWNQSCLFPEAVQAKPRQLNINFREITPTADMCTIFVTVAMWATHIIRGMQTANQKNLSDCRCLLSLHLKMLQTQTLELFSTGHSPNSETEFIICSNY